MPWLSDSDKHNRLAARTYPNIMAYGTISHNTLGDADGHDNCSKYTSPCFQAL